MKMRLFRSLCIGFGLLVLLGLTKDHLLPLFAESTKLVDEDNRIKEKKKMTTKSEEEWKAQLTPEQFRILRKKQDGATKRKNLSRISKTG